MIHPGNIGRFSYERWFRFAAWDDSVWVAGAYWKRIAVLMFLGLAGAVGYTRWYPQEYVSHATVRFIPPQVGESFVTSNMAMQVEQRIFAVTQLVNSRMTASQMIEAFDLYPQKRRLYPVADLLPQFQHSLRLITDLGGASEKSVPSVNISFRYSDPEKAQQVVQRVVELIYEESRRYRSDQSIGTTDFLDQELKTVTEQMSSLEQQLAALPTPGGEDKEYRNILKVEQLHDLERRLTDLQHNMNYVRGDLSIRTTLVQTLEDQLDARKNLGQDKPIPPSGATQILRGVTLQATERYEQLRRKYPAANLEVKAAERAMQQAKADLQAQEKLDHEVDLTQDLALITPQLMRARSEQAAYQDTLNKQLAEESSLARQIEQIRSQFTVTPQMEDLRLRVLREYEVAKSHYADLTRRQRESQLSSDMERRGHGETAELVEPPTLPLRAEYPQNWIVLTVGAGFGLGLGFAMALLSFWNRPMVRIPQHVEMLGGYPALISLPSGQPLKKNASHSTSLALPRSVLLTLMLGMLLTGCQSQAGGIEAQFRAGEQAAAKGDYRSAELYFRRVLQIDHRHGEAYLALSNAYIAQGQTAPAYESLVRAGELLQARADVAERLAELTYQIYFADPGRPAPLLREIEQRAANLMKKWPSRASGFRLAAQVLIELHRGQEAIRLMESALGSLEDASLRAQLAAAYYQAGERARAEEHLRLTIRAEPAFQPAYDLLYLQLMENGRISDARGILSLKTQQIGGLDAGLQVAAHDQATSGLGVETFLEELAARFQSAPDTFAKIGDFWLHRGQHDKARTWYEAGFARHPQHPGLYVGRRAELLMAEKKPEAARKLIDDQLRTNPADPLLRAYQAAMAGGSSQQAHKQMQAQLESVVNQMPGSSFVHLHLGRAYLLNGDALRARQQLRTAVSLDPNYAPGWLALAELEIRLGDAEQAKEQLTALLRRAPNYVPARVLQAQASLAQNKPGEAEAALEGLREADPENTDVILTLARTKMSLGRTQEASNLLDAASNLEPADPGPVLLQARMQVALGQTKNALTRLRAARTRFQNVPEIASLLGSVALVERDRDTAYSQFSALVQKAPGNLEYRLGYASSLALLGRAEQAKEQYRVVQAKAGNNPQPWLLYGSLLSSGGNLNGAVEAYRQAVKYDGKNPYALNNLAYLMARQGVDLKGALQMAEEARRTLPRSPEIQDTLAYLYVLLDMRRNALAALEQLAVAGTKVDRQRSRGFIAQIQNGDLRAVRLEMERTSADESFRSGL